MPMPPLLKKSTLVLGSLPTDPDELAKLKESLREDAFIYTEDDTASYYLDKKTGEIKSKAPDVAVFTPPTDSEPGKNGLVPAPAVMPEEQAQNSYLGADAKWHNVFSTPDYDNYIVVGTYKSTTLGGSTMYDYVMPTDGYLWCLNRLIIPKNGILNAVISIAKKEVVKNYQAGASSIQASHLIPVRKGTAVTFSLYMSSDATEPSEMDVRLYPLRRGD